VISMQKTAKVPHLFPTKQRTLQQVLALLNKRIYWIDFWVNFRLRPWLPGMESRAKFGKEIIAEAHRRPKWVHIIVRKLCSGSAQARLRYAHAQLRLKQQLLTSGD
jgi:hypothetical protein